MLKLKQLQQKQQLQRQNPAPEGQVAVFSDNTQTKEVGRMFSLKQEGKQKKEKPSACRLRVQVGMYFYQTFDVYPERKTYDIFFIYRPIRNGSGSWRRTRFS